MRMIKDNVERIAEEGVQADKLKKLGFDELPVVAHITVEPVNDISEMSIAKLKALAKEKGIEGSESLTKKELLEVLNEVGG